MNQIIKKIQMNLRVKKKNYILKMMISQISLKNRNNKEKD
jgi:hypothetical protein